MYFSLFGPKKSTKRKAALQLGPDCSSGLPSRNARTRGRQELVPLFAGLRQLAALCPRPHASLGCAAEFGDRRKKFGDRRKMHRIPEEFIDGPFGRAEARPATMVDALRGATLRR